MRKIPAICSVLLFIMQLGTLAIASDKPGKSPKDWRARLATDAKTLHKDVFPGIDLIYEGNNFIVSSVFVVNPGADPSAIQLDFSEYSDLAIDQQKHVKMLTADGSLQLQRVVFFQEINGKRQWVNGEFTLLSSNQVGVNTETYDTSHPLQVQFLSLFSTNLVAVTIVATKEDSLVDTNMDTQANPGDTLVYKIVIKNTGTASATGVTFDDNVDVNTTLVAGSVETTPIATDDSYNSIGNVGISVNATNGVLANDTDADGSGFAATPISAVNTTSTQGTVNLNTADGSFTYDPPAGFEGTDTFGYTVDDGEGNTETAIVSITISDMIWFIDNTDTGSNDGTLANPFQTLGAFNAVNGVGGTYDPKAGDAIFIHKGNANYTGGITLENSQILVGDGATADLPTITGISLPTNSYTPPTPLGSSNNPTIENSADNGEGIILAQDNTIRGINIGDAGSVTAPGVSLTDNGGSISNTGTSTISEVSINNSVGAGIDIANSGSASFTFNSISSTNSMSNGISLSSVSGNFSVTGTTDINSPFGDGIDLNSSGSLDIDFADIDIDGGTIGIDITGGVGDLDVSGTAAIDNTSGNGIKVSNSPLSTFDFGTTSLGSTTAVAEGIDISTSNTDASFTFNLSITTSAGPGLVANSSGTVNVTSASSTINATGGAALDIKNTTVSNGSSGAMTFASLTSTNSPTHGIRLDSVTGSLSVTGSTTISSPLLGILFKGGTDNATFSTINIDGSTTFGIQLQSNDGNFTVSGATTLGASVGNTMEDIKIEFGTGDVTFAGVDIDNRSENGISISQSNRIINFGATTIDNQLQDTDNAFGIGSSTGGSITISSLTIDNNGGVGFGVAIANSAAAVDIQGGSITGSNGTSFRITGGTANVDYSGTITTTVGRSVDIRNRTGGTVTFSGAIDDDGAGINLDSNTGSTITFQGGIALDTGFNPGFTAAGGGTVNVCDTNDCNSGSAVINTIETTTAPALNVANTSIGSSGLNFQSISASGGTSGIILNSTGTSGGLTVTGDGSPNSGGIITNSVNDGISATSTSDIDLNFMTVSNSGVHEIHLSNSTDFRITNSTINDNTNVAGSLGDDEHGIFAQNLFGVNNLIEDVTMSAINENGVKIDNNTTDDATRDDVIIRRLSCSGFTSAHGENCVDIESSSTANQRVDIQDLDATINANGAFYVKGLSLDISTLEVIVNSGEFDTSMPFPTTAVQLQAAGNSNTTFTVTNNTFDDPNFEAIIILNDDDATTNATITGNDINGATSTTPRMDIGIRLRQDTNGTLTALIDNNNISNYDLSGIQVISRDTNDGTGQVNVTVTSNTVASTRGSRFGAGVQLLSSGTNTLCADVGGIGFENNAVGAGSNFFPAFFDGDFGIQEQDSSTLLLPGLTGTVLSFIQGRNTGSPTVDVEGAPSDDVVGACSTPTP